MLGARVAGAHGGDVVEVAGEQRQQIVPHLGGHVGEQVRDSRGQGRFCPRPERGQVQPLAVVAVEDQRVLVGLESADDRIDRAVPGAEGVLDLALDPVGMRDRGLGVVADAGAAAVRVAAREVVGDQDEDAVPGRRPPVDVTGEDLAEMGPAQVEHPAEIAEGIG